MTIAVWNSQEIAIDSLVSGGRFHYKINKFLPLEHAIVNGVSPIAVIGLGDDGILNKVVDEFNTSEDLDFETHISNFNYSDGSAVVILFFMDTEGVMSYNSYSIDSRPNINSSLYKLDSTAIRRRGVGKFIVDKFTDVDNYSDLSPKELCHIASLLTEGCEPPVRYISFDDPTAIRIYKPSAEELLNMERVLLSKLDLHQRNNVALNVLVEGKVVLKIEQNISKTEEGNLPKEDIAKVMRSIGASLHESTLEQKDGLWDKKSIGSVLSTYKEILEAYNTKEYPSGFKITNYINYHPETTVTFILEVE